MGEITLSEKFKEWTDGLNRKDARVSVFTHIRDIPYMIVPELRDPGIGPAGMLKAAKGSCVPKHWLLGLFFEKLGIEVKYASYPFKWGDTGVKWPGGLFEIAKNLPVTCHLACKANIEDRWVLVDATYDLPLAKAGFTVNKDWDGVSETLNAVKPTEEIIHSGVEDRVRYDSSRRAAYTESEKTLYAEFIEKLNSWLAQIRQGRVRAK